MNIEVGQTWRHVKRQTLYEIISVDALVQCSTFPGFEKEMGGKFFVAYRGIGSGSLYFRPQDEFIDGRFEMVEPAPIPATVGLLSKAEEISGPIPPICDSITLHAAGLSSLK